MARRVTVLLDDDINKKVRLLQSKMIRKENKSTSFSSVVNFLITKNISKSKKFVE